MTERIIQKIESIRRKPEHVRLQYAIGAVAICMIFVLGIWVLTLKQGFFGVISEVNTNKEQAEETMSNVREVFPSTDSLRTLKENSESLRLNNTEDNADQFIQSELERKPVDPGFSDQEQQ